MFHFKSVRLKFTSEKILSKIEVGMNYFKMLIYTKIKSRQF